MMWLWPGKKYFGQGVFSWRCVSWMQKISGILDGPIACIRASITGNSPDFGLMLLGGSRVFKIPLTLQRAICIGPTLVAVVEGD